MGKAAVEIVSVAGPEDFAVVPNCDFNPTGNDDAAFFGLMAIEHPTRIGPDCVSLAENHHRPAGQCFTDLAQGHASLADFCQVLGGIENLSFRFRFEGEELRQVDGNTSQDFS